MVRVVKHLKVLPREVVDASSLETFRVRLDRALSNLVYLKVSYSVKGDWSKAKFPSTPNHSMTLRFCLILLESSKAEPGQKQPFSESDATEPFK